MYLTGQSSLEDVLTGILVFYLNNFEPIDSRPLLRQLTQSEWKSMHVVIKHQIKRFVKHNILDNSSNWI